MIMENHLITQFPDIISIKKSPTLGDPLFPRGWSSGRDQVNTRAGPAANQREEDQMPGSHLRFVRTLDLGVLDGLAARAAAEIRAAEDALIEFIEAEQKRDALHAKTKHEIAAKYNQQDRLGGAA
jgi:hypothetical protein